MRSLLATLRERIRRSQQAWNAAARTAQATALFYDYQRTSRLDLLNTAIELSRDAMAATPPDHPRRPLSLSNLGSALATRFERTGHLTTWTKPSPRSGTP